MHTEIEVRVVKYKCDPWKIYKLNAREIAWISETEECTWMYIQECPGHWKLTGKLCYAIFKNPQSTDDDFSISGQWKIPELQQIPCSEVEYDSTLGSSFTLSNLDYFAQ